MKIETFKISLAVADHVDYADVLDVVKTIADKTIGIYGIEIERVKPGEDGTTIENRGYCQEGDAV